MSYEEEDTCVSCEEEDTCVPLLVGKQVPLDVPQVLGGHVCIHAHREGLRARLPQRLI